MRFCGEEKKQTHSHTITIFGLMVWQDQLLIWRMKTIALIIWHETVIVNEKKTQICTARHIAKLIHYSSSSSKGMWLDKMRIKQRGTNSVKETKTMNEKKVRNPYIKWRATISKHWASTTAGVSWKFSNVFSVYLIFFFATYDVRNFILLDV